MKREGGAYLGMPLETSQSVLLNAFYHKKHEYIYEPWHGISNNVVCATYKASDQPVHTRSLIRAFASRLNIL